MKYQEIIPTGILVIMYALIIYTVILLQNNINILLIENDILIIVFGLLVLYYLFRRIVEFFSLSFNSFEVNLLFIGIVLILHLDSFSTLLSSFYIIIGLYLMFDLFYLIAKHLPIEYQLLLLDKENIVYKNESISIASKGILVKTLTGTYTQALTGLPGGKIDDLFKILKSKNGCLVESENKSYLSFSIEDKFVLNQIKKINFIVYDLEQIKKFVLNSLRYLD